MSYSAAICLGRKMSKPGSVRPQNVPTAKWMAAGCPSAICLDRWLSDRRVSDRKVNSAMCLHTEQLDMHQFYCRSVSLGKKYKSYSLKSGMVFGWKIGNYYTTK